MLNVLLSGLLYANCIAIARSVHADIRGAPSPNRHHCRSTATMRKQHFGPFHRNTETIPRQLSGTTTRACVHSHPNLVESLVRHPPAVVYVFVYVLYRFLYTHTLLLLQKLAEQTGDAPSVMSSARTNVENRLLVSRRWGMVSKSSVFVGLFP